MYIYIHNICVYIQYIYICIHIYSIYVYIKLYDTEFLLTQGIQIRTGVRFLNAHSNLSISNTVFSEPLSAARSLFVHSPKE